MANEGASAVNSEGGVSSTFNKLTEYNNIFFACGVLSVLAILLVPIPTMFLDFLLASSLTISLLILLTVLFLHKSLDFNSFPTVLLIAAMFRLSLNIASTRLILSEGHTGSDAAGRIINVFGDLVMSGSVIIGIIIFIILTIINFVVITKGSGRIAEVAARFNLDAMPGKQMAIDADLSAGLIDEETAKSRRKELEEENTFFGAMDGANKFVRGDAIAGLLITFINFVAGVMIGIISRDMSFGDAISTYTMLTIGDGLVSQIPAILVSTSAGLLVTKAGVKGSTDKAVLHQLGNNHQVLFMAATLLFSIGLIPGMPMFPFLFLAIAIGSIGYYVFKDGPKQAAAQKMAGGGAAAGGATAGGGAAMAGGEAGAAGAESAEHDEESVAEMLAIDSIRLELGYGLLPLINYKKGHRITDQIRALRKQLAKDLGFIMPSIRIQDNMQLETHEYVIKVKDIECGQGIVRPEMLLVMDPAGGQVVIPGEDTTEPAFGLPAKWIAENHREEAMFKNYTVVDPPTVITTHLTELIKENIIDLLSYAETQKLLDDVSEEHKKLVSDMIPSQISVSGVQRALQNLLAEEVSIRDLPYILEAVSEAIQTTQSITLITEHVRARLARQISHSNTNDDNYIPIIALSPQWEQVFMESLIGDGEEKQLSIAPSKLQEFIADIRKVFEKHAMRGEVPVLMTSPMIRPYVRSIVERFRASTIVMSQNEVHPRAKIKTLGQL